MISQWKIEECGEVACSGSCDSGRNVDGDLDLRSFAEFQMQGEIYLVRNLNAIHKAPVLSLANWILTRLRSLSLRWGFQPTSLLLECLDQVRNRSTRMHAEVARSIDED